jgi:hypothetical protein
LITGRAGSIFGAVRAAVIMGLGTFELRFLNVLSIVMSTFVGLPLMAVIAFH